MIDHVALRALIDAEPSNDPPATDAAVLAWWLGNVTVPTDLSMTDFMIWLANNGGRDRVEEAISHASEDVRNAARLMIDLLQSGAEELHLSRDDVRAALAPLVGSGKPFTTAHKNSLLALSDVQTPRWKAEGFPPKASYLIHITKARAL